MLPSPFRIAANRAHRRPAIGHDPTTRGEQASAGAAAPACSGAEQLQPGAGIGHCEHSPRAAQRRPITRSPLLPITATLNASAEPQSPHLSSSSTAAPLQRAAHSSPNACQQACTSDHGSTPRATRRRALVLSSPESPDTDRDRAVAEAGPARSGATGDGSPSAGLGLPRMAREGTLDAFLQRSRPSDAAPATVPEPGEAVPASAMPWKRPRLTVWCERKGQRFPVAPSRDVQLLMCC